MTRPPPIPTLFPYTTLFRSLALHVAAFAMADQWQRAGRDLAYLEWGVRMLRDGVVLFALLYKVAFSSMGKTRSLFSRISILDRKSTRLNSSHVKISYAVFCL